MIADVGENGRGFDDQLARRQRPQPHGGGGGGQVRRDPLWAGGGSGEARFAGEWYTKGDSYVLIKYQRFITQYKKCLDLFYCFLLYLAIIQLINIYDLSMTFSL